MLELVIYVARGLHVYPRMCEKNLRESLPFIATENLMMEAVKKGGDRQSVHEAIRRHAQETALAMKEEGAPNDLLERLAAEAGSRISLTKRSVCSGASPT